MPLFIPDTPETKCFILVFLAFLYGCMSACSTYSSSGKACEGVQLGMSKSDVIAYIGRQPDEIRLPWNESQESPEINGNRDLSPLDIALRILREHDACSELWIYQQCADANRSGEKSNVRVHCVIVFNEEGVVTSMSRSVIEKVEDKKERQ